MKRSLKELMHCKVKAKDGPVGKIKDFLFDQKAWIIRYIDADFGNWFATDRVLIPVIFLDDFDEREKCFPVRLSKEMIESGPHIEDHMPVSREYETRLASHYDLQPYWPFTYFSPVTGAVYFPSRPLSVPTFDVNESDMQTNLRSFREIKGYRVYATGKDVGSIADLYIDDRDCQIVYGLIDISNWFAPGKKILLSVEGMEQISYLDHVIHISVSPGKLDEAPEFQKYGKLSETKERRLYDYFSWGMVT
ncbi:MAG: PRC-barrel domain-containing protein [Bacteroidota bacterium]